MGMVADTVGGGQNGRALHSTIGIGIRNQKDGTLDCDFGPDPDLDNALPIPWNGLTGICNAPANKRHRLAFSVSPLTFSFSFSVKPLLVRHV